jgi:hypothetical protein
MVVCGAIYHWYPKITGTLVPRGHGAIPLLGDLCRLLPRVFAHALSRHHGRAPSLLRNYWYHFPARFGAERKRQHHHRCSGRWLCAVGVPLQPDCQCFQRQESARQSLECNHTRVANRNIRRPDHGNFGKELPCVYRWAYDYSVPVLRKTSFLRTCRRVTPRLRLHNEQYLY